MSRSNAISTTLLRAALFVLPAIAGCGGAAGAGLLAPEFPDDRPADVEAVLARMGATPPEADPGIVVGLTPAPMRLWAWDLEAGRSLWETEVAAETMPHVAGRWVAVEEGHEIVVRSLEDGRVTARIGVGELRLAGADGEGRLAVVTATTGGGVGARSRVIALSNGAPAWDAQLEHAVGAPAVRAGMIFLPWAQQNLSVIDGSTRAELARVRFARGVVGHAIAHDEHVFFGQRGITRLTGRTDSSADAAWFEPMERELPGDPGMLRDAYQPPPSPTSATHRVRLVWHATEGGGEEPDVGVLDQTIYLVFYKLVFALDAMRDEVRWVRELPGDVVGASAEDGGILVVDDRGRLHALSREDGRITWTTETGTPATWAHVSHARFQGGTPQGEPVALRDQLLAVVQSTDTRLVPARAYAARLLAALPDPDVTQSLIALCDDRSLPPALRTAACDALGSRETGTEHVLAALGRHASHLQGTTAPPVGALARAAARANAQAAVPLLVAHLRDAQTPASDLADLARALQALRAEAAIEPLDDFIRLYHAEAPDEVLGQALVAAIAAYTAIAGPASQETLSWVIDDPMSMPAAREGAQASRAALLAPPPADPGASPDPAQPGAQPGEQPGEMTITAAERPQRITLPMVTETLHPVEADLAACLVQPGRVWGQARVVLAIMPDGALQTVSVTPEPVQACIEPIVRSRTFPATMASTRQTITYTVTR